LGFRKDNLSKYTGMDNRSETLWATRLWLAFAGLVAGLVLFFWLLSLTELPTFEQLENPKTNFASEVLAYNGKPIGGFYVENRVAVEYEDLSPHLINALISTEDERFFRHAGIDFKALLRVVVKTVFLRKSSSGGGSTITQQLAKNLFHDPPGSKIGRVLQKFKEWIIAIRLENRYTKEEILTMYLNQIDFVNGAIGIKSASQIYFGKEPYDLSVEEAATFVGMLQNPSLYNPFRRHDATQMRRNVVLGQMVKYKHITGAERDSLSLLPIDMSNFKTASHEKGLAPYFRMEVAKDVKKILASGKIKKPDGSPYNLYRDGLKIYTTIDPEIQQLAEEAMLEHMKKLQRRFFEVRKNRDPWTHRDEKASLALRANSLDYLKRNSDRFLKTFDRMMSSSLMKLASETGKNDLDYATMVWLKDVQDKKQLKAKLKNSKKSSALEDQYESWVSSDAWPEVLASFSAFEQTIEEEFNLKTKMRVFAYQPPSFEKDTVLTPLDSIKYHRMHLQTGLVAVEPSTGHVKAWVGGINYKYFQYDHVRTARQVGSTFKPFIYATAIAMQGFSPCFPVADEPYVIQKGEGSFDLLEPWAPKNSDGKFTGDLITLYEALQTSKNTASVFLIKQLGTTEPVRNLLRNMGIDVDAPRNDGEKKIPAQPSIALGAADLTVLEMAGAYTSFANQGVYNKPIYITHIEDANGRVIYRNVPEEIVALPPNVNYVMIEMLRKARGAGYAGLLSDVGGKSGTTNDYVDGWYMALTPSLVIGTWVGGDDTWIRFLSLVDGQGSAMARPIIQGLLKRLENSSTVDYDKNLRFMPPSQDLGIVTDCEEYNNKYRYRTSERDSLGIFGDDFF
jgi:penicillin-binding protein 1A